MAAMFNRGDIAELLIRHGANVGAHDAKGMTALDAVRAMGAVDTPVLLMR